MLQRRQSLLLLISLIFNVLVLLLPLYFIRLDGPIFEVFAHEARVSINGSITDSSEHIWVMLLAIASAALTAATILLYSNRPLQFKLAKLGTLLNTALLVLIFFAIENSKESLVMSIEPYKPFADQGHYGLASFFPIVGMILCYLASRDIMKDEALVRSSDRIR